MTLNSEQIVRKAYQIAEDMDLPAWVAAFTEDGTFTDESIGVTYRGPDELPVQVENYKRAFPDMHRELLPAGRQRRRRGGPGCALPGDPPRPAAPARRNAAAHRRADGRAVLPNVFELADGKIKRFDCYPEGSIILTQLGVIGDLNAALKQ